MDKKFINMKSVEIWKRNNINELQTCPFRRTEVIFIVILCQGKGSFLFEIMCFKTTTERKSQPNIRPVVSGIVTRLNYNMTYWYEFSCPISSFKNGWNPYFFIFNFHIVMIGIIFSILWIRIILHDSNSWLAGWRTRRYSMTSKLDFYSIFFDSTWNWASVLCINYHFSIRIWTFPWKNHLISYFPN